MSRRLIFTLVGNRLLSLLSYIFLPHVHHMKSESQQHPALVSRFPDTPLTHNPTYCQSPSVHMIRISVRNTLFRSDFPLLSFFPQCSLPQRPSQHSQSVMNWHIPTNLNLSKHTERRGNSCFAFSHPWEQPSGLFPTSLCTYICLFALYCHFSCFLSKILIKNQKLKFYFIKNNVYVSGHIKGQVIPKVL